jgi:hypothetical protein
MYRLEPVLAGSSTASAQACKDRLAHHGDKCSPMTVVGSFKTLIAICFFKVSPTFC